VTGDRVPDIITAPGPGGGPHIRVFDGNTFQVVKEFMAYDPKFTGGVFVATSYIDYTGPSIITGAGAGGGPHVKVFDALTGATISSFFAYDAAFRGGVSVAGTDLYFDSNLARAATGLPYASGSVITGAGPGGGPHVKVFDGKTGALRTQFFAYESSFRGGVNVAARGQLYRTLDDTLGTIVVSRASNGSPDVRLFNPTGQQIGGFVAYDAGFPGVNVAVEFVGAFNGTLTLVTGTSRGVPIVRIWQVANGAASLQQSFLALDPASLGGVFVG
jgi:hypothetical protein